MENLLGPNTLIVCTFSMTTFVLWFYFCKTIGPLVPYPKSTLSYSILSHEMEQSLGEIVKPM